MDIVALSDYTSEFLPMRNISELDLIGVQRNTLSQLVNGHVGGSVLVHSGRVVRFVKHENLIHVKSVRTPGKSEYIASPQTCNIVHIMEHIM